MSGMGHLRTIPMAGCPLRPRAPTFAHLQKAMGAPSGHDRTMQRFVMAQTLSYGGDPRRWGPKSTGRSFGFADVSRARASPSLRPSSQ